MWGSGAALLYGSQHNKSKWGQRVPRGQEHATTQARAHSCWGIYDNNYPCSMPLYVRNITINEFVPFQATSPRFSKLVLYEYTASGQKYLKTTKLTCTKCDIYWVSAQLRSKKVIEIFKYLKYIVLATKFLKIFEI